MTNSLKRWLIISRLYERLTLSRIPGSIVAHHFEQHGVIDACLEHCLRLLCGRMLVVNAAGILVVAVDIGEQLSGDTFVCSQTYATTVGQFIVSSLASHDLLDGFEHWCEGGEEFLFHLLHLIFEPGESPLDTLSPLIARIRGEFHHFFGRIVIDHTDTYSLVALEDDVELLPYRLRHLHLGVERKDVGWHLVEIGQIDVKLL